MARLLLALFLILYFPLDAAAALNGGTVWELRNAGSDTNGGGFVTGISTKSSQTDLVTDATLATKVSSTGYGFTSADVGRYISITAGTGWTLGFYRVTAVTTGVATLDAAPAATSVTGGSFSVVWGLDYTQQAAANSSGSNISTTNAVANGSTTITSSTASFTNDIVGSVIYFSGGSGSIAAQRRAVTGFTNSTTITIDTLIASSTGMTMNIGGAIKTFDELFSARGALAGNRAFVKADGTYTTSAGYVVTLNPIWITGYTSARTDGGQATLQSSATSAYVYKSTGTSRLFNLIFDCNSVSGCGGLDINAGAGILYNITVNAYDGIGFLLEAPVDCDFCEAKGGTTNATAGIKPIISTAYVINSYVHDGNGPGIVTTSSGVIENNIVANQAGATADGIQASASAPILNNTVYNSGRHGINNTNTSLAPPLFHGNLLVNNAGFGILTAMTNVLAPMQVNDGNAFYGNGSGAESTNFTDRTGKVNGLYPYVYQYNQNLSGVPFVSAGAGNWALNNTGGQGAQLQGAGFPQHWIGTVTLGYPDMGAVKHNANLTPNFAH